MKHKFLLKTMLLLCILVGRASYVWAEKITDYTNIVSGVQYYIGATTGDTDYYLSVNGSSLTQSIAGTAVTSMADATLFTFNGSGTSWTIQFESGYYLSLKSSKDNGKVQVVENAATFSASNQSSKIRLAINNSFSIQKNNSGTQFGSYGNTQTDIWLEAATPTYTITAQSNNTNYGTVSLSGSVITGSPKSGYCYATPAYTVSPANSATVSQNGNAFTVTPSSNTTVTINFEAIPTHTATFSENGTTTTQDFAEGAAITFPSDPAAIDGKSFVGWLKNSTISGTTNEAPSMVNKTNETMGNTDVTYYAVYANVTTTYSESETEASQTLQYDTWSYNGTTSNMNTYRLFAEDAYIESASFDLSILKQVNVYAGTYGSLDNNKKKVSVMAGTTTWGTAPMSTNSATTKNEITSSTSLSGNSQLHIVAGGGNGSTTGIRISKVEIITKKASHTYFNYCTTVVATYSVTYDANGATSGSVPTDNTAYTSGQSVTVAGNTGNLAKTGYAFGGWNTQENGNGTNYAANATFSITANTTLYAKWNAKTITGLSYTGTPTKTTYNAGESFDPMGLTVTVSYSDASQDDVTASVTWTPNPLTYGTTSVTGTYMGQTINISGITVTAIPGSAERPYTVAEVINGTATGNDIYVIGYIVGEFQAPSTNVTSVKTDNFTTDANVALADNPTTTALASSIPIQLSTNTLKSAWGNQTNAGTTMGYKVLVKGNKDTYFTVNGIKSVSEVTAISANVTITNAGLATFASNVALDFTDTDIEAYIAKEENQGGNTVIALQKVNKVPAETGVLLRGTSDVIPVATGDMDNVTDNIFVRGAGNTVASSVTSGNDTYYNYILNIVNNQIGFYKANNKNVATNRAYLRTSIDGASRLAISFEEASGIATIEHSQKTIEHSVYDLLGRRVDQPTKGLYIVNGKKVVVK